MRKLGWVSFTLGVCLLAVPVAPVPAVAESSVSESLPGSLDGCQEVNLFFTVDDEKVRGLVPSRYALSRNANGDATLFIRGFDCQELVWNGDTRAGRYPVAGTTVSVLIESPDLTGVLNSYMLFVATNSPEYNQLAWHAADPELRVALVQNVAVEFSPATPLTTEFTAHLPAPTPSPFDAAGTVVEHQGDRNLAVMPFMLNFWHDTSETTLKFGVTVEGLELAPARVTITTPPDTMLAHMFGSTSATSDDGTSNHARFSRATVVRTLITR